MAIDVMDAAISLWSVRQGDLITGRFQIVKGI